MTTTFSEKVLSIAEKIPPGRVVAYWKLAECAGSPNPESAAGPAASAIHRVRKERSHGVPWWRAVTYDGKITTSGRAGQEQERRLREEGVGFDERGRVRWEFFWYPSIDSP